MGLRMAESLKPSEGLRRGEARRCECVSLLHCDSDRCRRRAPRSAVAAALGFDGDGGRALFRALSRASGRFLIGEAPASALFSVSDA